MESKAGIQLSPEDRARLEGWVAGRNTPQKLVWRARIVLMWAQGAGVTAIVRATGKTKRTAYRWRDRYLARGVAGLERDATRPGRKPPLTAAAIERVVNMTLNEKPPGATHWSARKLAKAVGLSHSSVQRIWAAHGLKPHLTRSFKLSNEPEFCEKVQDIVGLYLDPPDKALVLSVDEKSQIQALDRTQPGLPLKNGRAGTMTHDYKRHGTTTLFAALDVATGKVIGQCMPRHRHQEFLRFLRTIDHNTAKWLDLHLTVDNYATHKHPKVKAWLKRHPGFHLPLHPDFRLMDQSRRKLLRLDHPGRHPPRRVPQRRRTQDRHPSLPRPAQCRRQTVHLDRPRSRHPRKSRQRTTSVRVGTLGRPRI